MDTQYFLVAKDPKFKMFSNFTFQYVYLVSALVVHPSSDSTITGNHCAILYSSQISHSGLG